MKTKILYVSYNGMLEALGASQVLSYLYEMCDEYEFHLVTVEKNYDKTDKLNALTTQLEEKGIYYYPIPYHTSKIKKGLNVLRLYIKVDQVRKKEKINFFHCRAYFPAIIAYVIKKQKNIKYLFDTRGFSFDERADVGLISRRRITFKFLKKLEKRLYTNSSGVNMLSYEGKRIIKDNELFEGSKNITPIEVIPTCVSLKRFNFSPRNFEKPIKVGYVGNAIGWYDFDKTLKILKAIGKDIDYKFIIYNGNQHDYIRTKLNEHNIPLSKVHIEKVDFAEMPDRLKDIDLSIFYIRPLFSKKASAATKLGELLASGIPVITNDGVGDHKFYVEENHTGLIVDSDKIDQYDFTSLIPTIVNPQTSIQCRKVAEEYFSTKKGALKYKSLYKKIFVD